MIIIHGSDQVSAQNKLQELLNQDSNGAFEITRVDGKDLSPASLSQALTPSSLFSASRLVVIGDLLSLPQSKNKIELVTILKKSKTKNLILFETKNIHPGTIKSLSAKNIFHFKESPLVYKFLDNLTPTNPKVSLAILNELTKARQPLDMLFFMLARHVRQLIQVKSQGSLLLSPWQLSKLKKQSELFSLKQLLILHQDLYTIDKRQKTSQTKDLKMEIELCILKLSQK